MANRNSFSFSPSEIIIGVTLVLLAIAVSSKISFDLRSRAQYMSANIIVYTKDTGQLLPTSFYHAFVQGGEEAGDMLSGIAAETRALAPKLIRLDHIYDSYDVVGKQGDNLAFDFRRLDTVLKTIRDTGATPMLALSYMPRAIARDGSIINPPENWNDWTLTVQKTIEHVSGTTGLNISDVYYEVWNEPDHPQFGGWKTYGDKNYLMLYHAAAEGAGRAAGTNRFFFGGPATTGLYKAWIDALLKSGDRVDFLSWHTYNETPADFAADQEHYHQWLAAYPDKTQLPAVISEFGFSGNKDSRYGTAFASAFTAAVVRQLADDPPQYMMSFQLKDGPHDEDGKGWGMITHETNGKRPKSRYFVYPFLDVMAGLRLRVSGEGSSATAFASRSGDTVRALLVQFSPEQDRSETVPVTFSGLDPGDYQLSEMYFQGVSATMHLNIPGTTLTKTVYLPANGIVRLELTRTND